MLAGETRTHRFDTASSNFYQISLYSTLGDVDLYLYKEYPVGTRELLAMSETPVVDRVDFTTFGESVSYEIDVVAKLDSTYEVSYAQEKLLGPPMPTQQEYAEYVYSPASIFDLARSSGCLACHSAEKGIVGPAWGLVSLRLKNEPGELARLVTKIKMGGKGYWGNTPMPPATYRATDADIELLARTILFGDP